jgi:hypothetical protein
MAPRKTTQPANTAESSVSESIQRVEATAEAPASGRIPLSVTPTELADCVARQQRKLIQVIREPNTPPVDGAIQTIMGALDALARIDAVAPEPVAEKDKKP